jgi:hypothetical protein
MIFAPARAAFSVAASRLSRAVARRVRVAGSVDEVTACRPVGSGLMPATVTVGLPVVEANPSRASPATTSTPGTTTADRTTSPARPRGRDHRMSHQALTAVANQPMRKATTYGPVIEMTCSNPRYSRCVTAESP